MTERKSMLDQWLDRQAALYRAEMEGALAKLAMQPPTTHYPRHWYDPQPPRRVVWHGPHLQPVRLTAEEYERVIEEAKAGAARRQR